MANEPLQNQPAAGSATPAKLPTPSSPTQGSGQPPVDSSVSKPVMPVGTSFAQRPAVQQQSQIIQKPAAAVITNTNEPIIYAMPAEYYGLLPKTPVKKNIGQPSAPVQIPKPAPKPAQPNAAPKTAGKKIKIPVVLWIGIAFLIVIAFGGYLFLQSLKPQAQTIDQPVPTPKTICGNRVCEANETVEVCPIDCAPIPSPAPAPIPEPPSIPPSAPTPIRSGIDSDSDGLTDVEETSVFISEKSNPDSDGDGYIDGNEVFNLYDPTKKEPARLYNNQFIEHIDQSKPGMNILFPKGWLQSESESEILLKALTGETVSVSFIESAEKDAKAFALLKYPDETFSEFVSKQGYRGLRNSDKRTIILPVGNGYAILVYNLEEIRSVEFLRTFEMIVNSFQNIVTLQKR